MKIITNTVELSNDINADILDSVFANAGINNMNATIQDLDEGAAVNAPGVKLEGDIKIVQNGLSNGFVEKKPLTVVNGEIDFDEISNDDFQLVLESSDDDIKLDEVNLNFEGKIKKQPDSKIEESGSQSVMKIVVDQVEEIGEIDCDGKDDNSSAEDRNIGLDNLLDCDEVDRDKKDSTGIHNSLQHKNKTAIVIEPFKDYGVNSNLDKRKEEISDKCSSVLEKNISNMLDEDSLVLETSEEINNFECGNPLTNTKCNLDKEGTSSSSDMIDVEIEKSIVSFETDSIILKDCDKGSDSNVSDKSSSLVKPSFAKATECEESINVCKRLQSSVEMENLEKSGCENDIKLVYKPIDKSKPSEVSEVNSSKTTDSETLVANENIEIGIENHMTDENKGDFAIEVISEATSKDKSGFVLIDTTVNVEVVSRTKSVDVLSNELENAAKIKNKDINGKDHDRPSALHNIEIKTSTKEEDKVTESIDLPSLDAELPINTKVEFTESIDLPSEDVELSVTTKDELTESIDLPIEDDDLSVTTKVELTESIDLPNLDADLSVTAKDELTESIDLPIEDDDLSVTTKVELTESIDVPNLDDDLSATTKDGVTKSVNFSSVDDKLSLPTKIEFTESSDLPTVDAELPLTTKDEVTESVDLTDVDDRDSIDGLEIKMDIDESSTEIKHTPKEDTVNVANEAAEMSEHTAIANDNSKDLSSICKIKSENKEMENVSASILEEITTKLENERSQDVNTLENSDQSNKDIKQEKETIDVSTVLNVDETTKETSLATRKRPGSEVDVEEADLKKLKHEGEEKLKISDGKTANESAVAGISDTVSTLKRSNMAGQCEADVKRLKLSEDDENMSICSQVVQDCVNFAESKNEERKDVVVISDSESVNMSGCVKTKKKKVQANTSMSNLDLAIDRVAKNLTERSVNKIQLLKKFHKEKLSNLTRHDLEELVVVKACEALTDRSTIGELRNRCNKVEQNCEMWRKKATQLEKSIRDLDLVLKRYLSEVSNAKKDRQPVPIKVTRSVGLQVSLTTMSGNRKSSNEARKSMNAERRHMNSHGHKSSTSAMAGKSKTPIKVTPQPQPGNIKTMLPKRNEDMPSPVKTPVRSRSTTPAPNITPSTSPRTNNRMEVIDLTEKDERSKVTQHRQQIQPKQQVQLQQQQFQQKQHQQQQQRQKLVFQQKQQQVQQPQPRQVVPQIQNQGKKIVQQNQVRPQQQVQKVQKVLPMQQTRPQQNNQSPTRFTSPVAQNSLRFVQAQLSNSNSMAILVPTSVASSGNPRPQHLIIAATTPPNQLRSPTVGMATSRPRTTPPAINVNGNSSVMIRTSQVVPVHQSNQGVLRSTPASIPIISSSMTQIRPNQGLPAFKHPAPLPPNPVHPLKPNMKLPPPKPQLKIAKTVNGIMLSWSMSIGSDVADIASYQLFAYQEGGHPPSTSLWKKVGDVKALPLPMACTLTQFLEGHKYHFSVRAMDIHSRIGPYSTPGSIVLTSGK